VGLLPALSGVLGDIAQHRWRDRPAR